MQRENLQNTAVTGGVIILSSYNVILHDMKGRYLNLILNMHVHALICRLIWCTIVQRNA